jgi:hypothetical protein
MKKATATSHGSNRFGDLPGGSTIVDAVLKLAGLILVVDGIGGLRDPSPQVCDVR